MDDLQKQLKQPGRPPKAMGSALDAVREALLGKKKKKEVKSPSDLDQWIVRANETFSAASSTTPLLPPGVYDVQQDSEGLIVFAKKSVVTDDLIDLHDSNSKRVLEGIKKFWTKKEQYAKHNVIYKRGILLWGPPGSGKTVTLILLMNQLVDQGGIVFIVKNPAFIKAALRQFRSIEPVRPIIVIFEDIDEIIRQSGEHELLALLDGENQTDNIVSLATTNYPEELGARIVNRPSRFDEVIKIDMPSEGMRRQYLKHILKGDETFPMEKALKDTERLSISHVKELVIAVTCLDQPYEEVIQRLKTMKVHPKPKNESGNAVGFGT